MKNLYILLITLFAFTISQAQIVNIPDVNFKSVLVLMGVDTNNDGEIQVSEAESVISLSLPTVYIITSLEGIESFTNLEVLELVNHNISILD